ncbi:MAG: hypothetical protein ABIG80_03165, partial [Patescibacteria group bacterium]
RRFSAAYCGGLQYRRYHNINRTNFNHKIRSSKTTILLRAPDIFRPCASSLRYKGEARDEALTPSC